MGVHAALTAGDITNLTTGPHTVRWYLAACNDVTTIATAQIDAPSGLSFPLATLNVKATSANWASVAPGMSVAIGSAAGLSDYGIFRVRKAGSATTLYIGETSWGDNGLITLPIRTQPFGDSSYITVYLNRYDLWSVIPRIIAASNTLYEDYDAIVSSANTTPAPMVSITVNGTGDRWAGFVDAGQTYRTVTLLATPTLWPTSTSITSYAWVIPATWTLTGGSLITNTITCRVPASLVNYTVTCAVTENNGAVFTAVRNVWAFDRASNAPIPVAGLDLTWDRTGARATVTLNDAALAKIPLGAMVYLFSDSLWNGADIPSAVTGMVGWVIRQEERSEPGLRTAALEVVGPVHMLEKLGSYSQYFAQAGSPANWQQVVPALQYVDFWIWWCLAHRAAGVLQLFNYTPIGLSNLQGRLPQSRIESAGSLLGQCRDLAQGYNANFGANPDGEIMVRRHPNYLAYPRSGTVTRATLNQSRMKTHMPSRMNKPNVRRVRGEGFYWNGVSALPTPYLSDAPGDAPGQGVGDDTLAKQFVDSQADLNSRTGLHYAVLNNPYPDIPITIEGNWGAMFYPADMALVGLSLPAANRPDNAAFAMNGIPQSVALRFIDGGAVDTSLSLEGETSGVTGVTVPVPAQVTANTTYASVPAPKPTGTGIGTPTHNGASVLAADNNNMALTTGWFDSAPSYTKLGKPTGTILAVLLDPFSDFLGVSQSGNLGCWCLTTGGLFYTNHVLTLNPVWTLKQSIVPTAGVLRAPIWAQGVVYVCYVTANGTSVVNVKKLSSYGSTTDWSQTVGSASNGNSAVAMDIDQNGADEALVGAYDSGVGGGSVYRIINGGAPSRITGTTATGRYISFIQKPLQTFAGAMNTSTGASENFVYATANIWTIVLNFTSIPGTGTAHLSYLSQGGGTASFTANGYGGLGVYQVGDAPLLTGDSTTFITSYEITGHLVNPSGTGTLTLGLLAGISKTYTPGTTGDYDYTLSSSDGPFNGTVGTRNIYITFSGPDYPGNNYETYLKTITLRGIGTQPTVTAT